MNIKTSNFSAEYGRHSGAAINVITRGGGNEFHGAAFEFLRNNAFDARNFFAPQKGKLRYNDFGWDLGGPVRRNKLFFFAGEEWKKIRQDAAPRLATLPTRAERLGDFNGRAGTLNQPGTSTPVPGRNVANLITPDGRAIANVFTKMEQLATSYVDTPTGNNTVYQFASPFDWRQDLIRLDYAANEKHSVYGRYIHDSFNLVDPFPVNGLPTNPINRVRPGTSVQLTHTWTIAANAINEARGAAGWSAQRRNVATDTWQRDPYGFVFPQIFSGGPLENGLPSTSITGFTSFSGPLFLFLSPNTDISFTDNFTWVKGDHMLKTGTLIVRNRKSQNGRSDHTGNVAFSTAGNPLTTGNAFADALLGNYHSLQTYVTKRAGNLQLTGSYTWSKVLTDASGEGDNPENYQNRHFSYGPATFDRRHIFVTTYTYHLPFGRNFRGAARAVVAGWDLSGINRFQTGPLSTVTGTTSIGSRRADYGGGSVSLPSDERLVSHYFNTAAFAPAPDTRRGNSGVGIVASPSLFLWDLSARKEFAITERIKVRFQADMFNLLNHTNFRGVNTDSSSRDFGSISAAGPARNIQFGVKAHF